MAFGTGHHPTTRMCLELVEQHVQPNDRVLDLGCGSGILSIAAAKLGASNVFGLEIDPIAASVAVQNVKENGVQDVVSTEEATLPHPRVVENGYDLLVANVSAKVITELAEHIVRAVRSGGTLIFSGILDKQQAEVTERMVALGVQFDEGLTDADWVALVGRVGLILPSPSYRIAAGCPITMTRSSFADLAPYLDELPCSREASMVIRAPACLHSRKNRTSLLVFTRSNCAPNGMLVTIRVSRVDHEPMSRLSNDCRNIDAFPPASRRSAISAAAESTSNPTTAPCLVLAQGRVEYGTSPHERIEHEAVGFDACQLK